MSLRKFMHPRNKYKQEPNFKQLAILYPEFRKIAITDLAGKVHINFQDLESLRILAKTLLKHDFDLIVDIPPSKLVPAIPSRLNYVLWIEDIVRHANFTDMSLISGIDVGTGAVCVYPLLFSKIYGCKMIGTEIDSESYESAVRNVYKNNLQHLVSVIRVNEGTVLRGSLPERNDYTFTMCNPPFFCTEEGSKNNGNRMPPRNAPSGSKVELVVKGGETQFVSKMIQESIELKEQIKFYTTMLGKKTSLLFLRNELKKLNIENTTWTEFCQGHTTRWGLAWSFLSKDVIDLTTAPVTRISGCNSKSKQNSNRPPLEITFPIRDGISETKELVTTLKLWMNGLKIRVEEINVKKPAFNCWGCQLMADTDTWSHERRKRRMMAKQDSPSKRCCPDDSGDLSKKETKPSASETHSEVQSNNGSYLLCNMVVGEVKAANDDDDNDETRKLRISMGFESGSGGRNALETLKQYLINKLNIRDLLKDQSLGKGSQKKQRVRKKKVVQ